MTPTERATKAFWDLQSMQSKPRDQQIQVIADAIEAAVDDERERWRNKMAGPASFMKNHGASNEYLEELFS